MIYDASTRGRKTRGPELWWRLSKVLKIAKERGFTVPPPTAVNMEASPAISRVNWGAWIADCPTPGCGGAEDIWLTNLIFFCMLCGNKDAGGVWRPVQVPENRLQIEAQLEKVPREQDRNWAAS